jgi:hypothetical protein
VKVEGDFYSGTVELDVALLLDGLQRRVATSDNHIEMYVLCSIACAGYRKVVLLLSVNRRISLFYTERDIVWT